MPERAHSGGDFKIHVREGGGGGEVGREGLRTNGRGSLAGMRGGGRGEGSGGVGRDGTSEFLITSNLPTESSTQSGGPPEDTRGVGAVGAAAWGGAVDEGAGARAGSSGGGRGGAHGRVAEWLSELGLKDACEGALHLE